MNEGYGNETGVKLLSWSKTVLNCLGWTHPLASHAGIDKYECGNDSTNVLSLWRKKVIDIVDAFATAAFVSLKRSWMIK